MNSTMPLERLYMALLILVLPFSPGRQGRFFAYRPANLNLESCLTARLVCDRQGYGLLETKFQ